MPKLFRVTEDDLAELERILPQLGESLVPVLNNRTRVQLRRCQSILSDIRWNYGPPTEVAPSPINEQQQGDFPVE